MPWSTAFDDPVRVDDKRELLTLQQAADYIMHLPEDAQHEAHWQTAIETLIEAAETGGGWVMFARIAMLRAMNAGGRRS
jgi:ketol-acid reductoisomerase